MLILSSPDDSVLQKLWNLAMEQRNFPEDHPQDYSSEGTVTNELSMDKLSVCSTEDNDLDFLQDLGPRFCTLGEIVQQGIKQK